MQKRTSDIMRKTFIAAAAILALGACTKGHAALISNALISNALNVNAITSNAITSNAITSNAITSNAITSNALTANAITSNGLHVNGTSEASATVVFQSVSLPGAAAPYSLSR
ncbi:MAG: hypothetical protein JWR10_4306 [Rubritepida sp.]|nr:hypothetical protein [Rubritepida sp.]